MNSNRVFFILLVIQVAITLMSQIILATSQMLLDGKFSFELVVNLTPTVLSFYILYIIRYKTKVLIFIAALITLIAAIISTSEYLALRSLNLDVANLAMVAIAVSGIATLSYYLLFDKRNVLS